MNIILKKRQLILATLVVALGAAVFVNWYYTGNSSVKSEDKENSQYVQNLGEAKYVNATESAKSFEQMKFDRQKNHDNALSKLNKSLETTQKGSNEAKEIAKSINALTDTFKKQIDLEALIKTTIKAESYVTLSEKSATVVVTKGKLNENTSLKVLELVTANTQIEASEVTISELKVDD